MRFFPYPEPRLSIFASVRANCFVFVGQKIFLLPATFFRIIILLFLRDKSAFQYLVLDIHLIVAGA
ncbi:MAG: hypothetical protein A2566_01265 [Candidatus Zambryskibacteria bacterium RIFOXYD1_FULL_40_13]|nr:MAG: hypothetical protein A2566_01265 [Candidatus Zambryskibacteria bacterium RIFOXYD1_FULL_40_13]HBO17631.1 hypothetical protein [Candidatus Zambryskibacteria bacterium]HCH59550.1 hypothetical protein [Candidatus Zambryskibacteria bacterium]